MSGALEAAILSKLTQDGKAKTPRRKVLRVGETWTCPAGVRTVDGMVIGNGAFGATSYGGSSGEIIPLYTQTVTPGYSYPVTIAARTLGEKFDRQMCPVPSGYFVGGIKTTVAYGVVALGNDNFIYRSNDGGYTWTKGAAFPAAMVSSGVVFYSPGPNRIMAIQSGVSSGMYSADDGVTWTATTFGFPDANQTLTTTTPITTDVAGVLVFGVSYGANGGMSISSDYGKTWTRTAPPTTNRTLKLSWLGGANYMFSAATSAASLPDLWVSSNSGATWTAKTLGTSSGATFNAMAVSATGHAVAYVYTGSYVIMRTTDYGATWTVLSAANYPGTSSFQAATSIVFLDAPGKAIIWTNNAQALVTADNGLTWTAPAGTTPSYFMTLLYLGSGHLFGVYNNQAYVSSNYGVTWASSFSTSGLSAVPIIITAPDTIAWLNGTIGVGTGYGASLSTSEAFGGTFAPLIDLGGGRFMVCAKTFTAGTPNVFLSASNVTLATDSAINAAGPGVMPSGSGATAIPGAGPTVLNGGAYIGGTSGFSAHSAENIPGVTSGGTGIAGAAKLVGQGGSGANPGAPGGVLLNWSE